MMNENEFEFEMTDEPTTFPVGDMVLMETKDGLEIGYFIGAAKTGIMFRASHRVEAEESDPDEVLSSAEDLVQLSRTVLTFVPWSRILKIELASEYYAEQEVRDFRVMLENSPDGPGEDEEA